MGVFDKRKRKEHFRLLAETKQMAVMLRSYAERSYEKNELGFVEAQSITEDMTKIIQSITESEETLEKGTLLPDAEVGDLLGLHRKFSGWIDAIER